MANFIKLRASLDTAAFDAALREYASATSRDMRDVVRQQSKLFLRDLLGMMKPGSPVELRKKIERDVHRVFITPKSFAQQVEIMIQKRTKTYIAQGYEAHDDTKWRNKRLGRRIEQLWWKNDAASMEALWRNVYKRAINDKPVTDTIEPARLNAARNKRGTVPDGARGRSVIFAGNPAKLRAFVRARQAHIGIAKAGWEAAAVEVGAAVPAWVRKQPRKFGAVVTSDSETSPFVEMINRAASAVTQDAEFALIAKAMHLRENNMRFITKSIIARRAKRFSAK